MTRLINTAALKRRSRHYGLYMYDVRRRKLYCTKQLWPCMHVIRWGDILATGWHQFSDHLRTCSIIRVSVHTVVVGHDCLALTLPQFSPRCIAPTRPQFSPQYVAMRMIQRKRRLRWYAHQSLNVTGDPYFIPFISLLYDVRIYQSNGKVSAHKS